METSVQGTLGSERPQIFKITRGKPTGLEAQVWRDASRLLLALTLSPVPSGHL